MNRNKMLVVGVVIILLAAGAAQFLFPRTVVSPTQTVYEPPAVEINEQEALDIQAVNVIPTSKPAQVSFAVAQGDTIASWNFKNAYTGNPELIEKAQAEIKNLSSQLETATSTAMILSVGIANQYELLGDGKNQYNYLVRAIETNSNSGLPWHNMGVLMERLGALNTARISYEKAFEVQPTDQFKNALADFNQTYPETP